MYRLRRNPRPFLLIGLGIAILMVFVVVVGPLFNTGGIAMAELDGVLPTRATGSTLEVDLELNNTGAPLIKQACIEESVHGPLRPVSVTYQGVDTEPFVNGRACGGSLNGSESVSLAIHIALTGTGPALLSLTPADGETVIGTTLTGQLTVS